MKYIDRSKHRPSTFISHLPVHPHSATFASAVPQFTRHPPPPLHTPLPGNPVVCSCTLSHTLSRTQHHAALQCILLGDAGVGKTCLVGTFMGENVTALKPTVGLEYKSKVVAFPDGTSLKVQIWDTAGQERCGEEERREKRAR